MTIHITIIAIILKGVTTDNREVNDHHRIQLYQEMIRWCKFLVFWTVWRNKKSQHWLKNCLITYFKWSAGAGHITWSQEMGGRNFTPSQLNTFYMFKAEKESSISASICIITQGMHTWTKIRKTEPLLLESEAIKSSRHKSHLMQKKKKKTNRGNKIERKISHSSE